MSAVRHDAGWQVNRKRVALVRCDEDAKAPQK